MLFPSVLFLFCIVHIYADTSFQAATVIITQNALNDAPERYATFISQALAKLQEQTWPNYASQGSGCSNEYYIVGSDAQNQVSLVPGSLKIEIQAPNNIAVWADFYIITVVPAYVKACKHIIDHIGCMCAKYCDGITQFSASITTYTVFTITFDQSNGQLVISSNPQISVTNYNIEGCSFPSWVGIYEWLGGDVQVQITQVIVDTAQEIAQQLTQSYSVPQVFELTTDVFVEYSVDGLEFQTTSEPYSVITNFVATVIATVMTPNGPVNYTFDDTIPGDAQMTLPTNWNMTNANGDPLLNGIRLSSTFLTATMWSIDVLGILNNTYTTQILDAFVTFKLLWDPPFIYIPTTDTLYLLMEFGSINGSCRDVNDNDTSVIIQFHFSNLQGNGTVIPNANADVDPGFIVQVLNFDINSTQPVLDAPPIPLPPAVLTSVLRSLLAQFIPLLNDYLAAHPFLLPPNEMPYFPNPVLHLYNEPGCCNDTHGYIEMATYCSCDGTFFQKCNYDCEVKRKIEVSAENSNRSLALSMFTASDCKMNLIGQIMIVSTLTETSGNCEPLPVNSTIGGYYSLTIHSDYSSDILLFCDPLCQLCYFTQTSVKLEHCYPKATDATPCFGPASPIPLYTPLWVQLIDSPTCNLSVASSVSVLNMGISAGCQTLDPSLNQDFVRYFLTLSNNSSLSSVTVNGTTGYKVQLWCNFDNCSDCEYEFPFVEPGKCINMTTGMTGYLTFVTKEKWCIPKSKTPLIVGTTLGILAFIHIIIIFVYLVVKTTFVEKLKNAILAIFAQIKRFFEFLKKLVIAIAVKLKEVILLGISTTVKFFKTNFGKPQKERFDFIQITLVILLASQIAATATWFERNPFRLFQKGTIDRLGIPSDLLDSQEMEYMFSTWAQWGQFVSLSSLIIVFFLSIFRVIITSTSPKVHLVSVTIIGILMYSQLVLFLAPSFMLDLKDAISVNANFSSSLKASTDLLEDCNEIVGYSFIGITLSYLANIFLFILQGISPAFYLASLVFMLRSKIAPYHSVLHVIRLCNFLLLLLFPVLYQSLGVDAIWMAIWFSLWTISFILFLYLRKILTSIEKDSTNIEAQVLIQLADVEVTRTRVLAKHKIHLWTNLAIFCVVTFGVMTYMAVKENTFGHMDVLFLVFLHINIFCNAFALSVMLLHWWNRETHKKEMKAYKSNDPSDHKSHHSNRASNLGSINAPKKKAPNVKFGMVFVRMFDFFREKDECTGDPQFYGRRVSFRRLFLFLGVVAMGYESFNSLAYSLRVSVKQELINWLDSLNIGLTWPDDNHGGTIFDDAFHLYGVARDWKIYFELSAWACFVVAMFADWSFQTKKGIKVSRIFGVLGAIVLIGSELAPAVPNYLSATHIDKIIPHCAPEFDNMIRLITLDIVGVACALLFTVQIGALLFSIPVAIVRGGALMLIDFEDRPNMKNVKFSLKVLWVMTSLLSPIVTMLPALVFFQLFGDTIVGILLACFWLLPIIIAIVPTITPKVSLKVYVAWMLSYTLPLISLFAYELVKHGITPLVMQIIKNPDTWISILAEIFLSLVVLIDLLFSQL